MPATDLIIWYLAIYGMAWTLVHSKIMQPFHDFLNRKYQEQKLVFLYELFSCIVCVSFWCAVLFVNKYFNAETLQTKILICFSNVAFTWFMANRFGDREDF